MEPGILKNVPYNLGFFDECLGFKSENYTGRYCLGERESSLINLTTTFLDTNEKFLLIQNSNQYLFRRNTSDVVKSYNGRCLPTVCNENDFKLVFGDTVYNKSCYTKDLGKELPGKTRMTIYLLGALIILVVISSVYEYLTFAIKKMPYCEICTTFSVITNSKKLFKIPENTDTELLCLNGLKSLSIFWIIFYQEWKILSMGPVDDYDNILRFLDKKLNVFFLQGEMGIDTFFTIGGILTSYNVMKNYRKKEHFGFCDVLRITLHRIARLTPPLGIMVLIYATVLPEIGTGPLWKNMADSLSTPCNQYWWSTILYVQNYVNPESYCIVQSWYISADMQLFLISGFILLMLVKFPKTTIVFILVLIFIGFGVNFNISYVYELPNGIFILDEKSDEYFKKFHSMPYCRYSVYLLGILCGCSLHKLKKKSLTYKLTMLGNVIAWIITLLIIIGCIFSPLFITDREKNIVVNSIYNSVIKLIFSMGICLLVLLCATGNGGFISKFLSLKIFRVLSKLVYPSYLIHFAVISCRVFSTRSAYSISEYYVVFNYFGDLIVTFILAAILAILIDFPCRGIYKVIFEKNCCERRLSKFLEKSRPHESSLNQ
ncbi:unnamed protein product [Brassicogethes aeneus]|uniref:Nose resistant to fluoxetine protein 6 n=1 Tax=Brassicogethes aeneus TaxID=1431903 RepID=A0A9P0BEH2_BRAAE|nr:unnamed protein product [Brassicogethes aeneus]